jgi:DNA-binding YbaB/EbfC family protein
VEPQMDMQQLFAAAQQMQEQLMNAQQALADAEVTGTAGGGLVKATVNGQGELMDLSISASAVDTADAEETARTIADLVLAAVRDAYRSAENLQQQQMGPFAAAMSGGGLPGMPGMPPGMPGMPGAGGLSLPGGLDLSSLGIGLPAGELDEDDDEYEEDDDDEDDDET